MTDEEKKAKRKQNLKKGSDILSAAAGIVDKLKDPGLSGFTPSATPVRSGASTGAKTVDPWRSFKSENGQVNDND